MSIEGLEALRTEIRDLYCCDDVPWVVGLSGGKDSTTCLQLIWLAIADLPVDQRTKPIHVISTDTLVENPMVSAWVEHSLKMINEAAADQGMPIRAHLLTPALNDSYWVCLLGHGYSAPRQKHRWCTERLKIKPSNKFIRDTVAQSGEAILVLGTRRLESVGRGARMAEQSLTDPRERLADNASLPGCKVYTPIEDWSVSQVWYHLLSIPNPWGMSNKDLRRMYNDAEDDQECPTVVDTSTPSCGKSRFGCWTCTLVSQDKSMHAMVQNSEHSWMQPLLEFRSELEFRGDDLRARDRRRRDFRRSSGALHFYVDAGNEGRLVPGPYTQEARSHLLRRLLQTQQAVREQAPAAFSDLVLIRQDELEEIRRIWVEKKGEIEDLLPRIYEEETGEAYPGHGQYHENQPFDADAFALLAEICGDDEAGLEHYRMLRNLLAVEHSYRGRARRHDLFGRLESVVDRDGFRGEDEALDFARRRHNASQRVEEAVDDERAETVDAEITDVNLLDRQVSLDLVASD